MTADEERVFPVADVLPNCGTILYCALVRRLRRLSSAVTVTKVALPVDTCVIGAVPLLAVTTAIEAFREPTRTRLMLVRLTKTIEENALVAFREYTPAPEVENANDVFSVGVVGPDIERAKFT